MVSEMTWVSITCKGDEKERIVTVRVDISEERIRELNKKLEEKK
jgi:hypothetical protein